MIPADALLRRALSSAIVAGAGLAVRLLWALDRGPEADEADRD